MKEKRNGQDTATKWNKFKTLSTIWTERTCTGPQLLAFIWFLKTLKLLVSQMLWKWIPDFGCCGAKGPSTIWARSCENVSYAYANNKGADQPVHPRSLISTFVVLCLDSMICILAIFTSPKTHFHVIWLISNCSHLWDCYFYSIFSDNRAIWAVTWQNECVPSKDSDQPGQNECAPSKDSDQPGSA